MAKVLIVDDVRDGSQLMAEVVSQIGGHEAMTADSGPDALDLIESARPDVVLLDISMPDMDGFQVLRELRLRYQEMGPKVLMLSAHKSAQLQERAAALGAVGYLVKGELDIDGLLRQIAELADK